MIIVLIPVSRLFPEIDNQGVKSSKMILFKELWFGSWTSLLLWYYALSLHLHQDKVYRKKLRLHGLGHVYNDRKLGIDGGTCLSNEFAFIIGICLPFVNMHLCLIIERIG